MIETSFGYLYLRCSTSCYRFPSWRVVVLHVLSASRFLTGMITQLPLFTLSSASLFFFSQTVLFPFARYSVITLCFPVRTMPLRVLPKQPPSTFKWPVRASLVAYPFIASVKQQPVFTLCWTLFSPCRQQRAHDAFTLAHIPLPCWGTHARFKLLVMISRPKLIMYCVWKRTLDGQLIRGDGHR